jgi:hypothetical protein
MIKQISLIALAIGIATVIISGTNYANGLGLMQAQQPILSAGHDQLLRCGVAAICVTNGHGESIDLTLPQAPRTADGQQAAAK